MPEHTTRISEGQAKTIKQRIDVALEFARKEYHPLCERALKLWKGEHWPDMRLKRNEPRVVVNYIQPTVQTKWKSIGFTFPEFVLKPLDDEGDAHAEIALPALKYEYRMAQAQEEAKRALWDMLVCGNGYVYTGWLFETEMMEGEPAVRLEGGRLPVEGEEGDQTPDPLAKEPPVPVERVREDRFYCRRIAPQQMFVDPEAGPCLQDAAYCGYWTIEPLETVKNDRRYSNTRDLKGNAGNLRGYFTKEMEKGFDSEEQIGSDLKRVRLFHYYEKKRRLHVVMCDEHDKPLLVEKWIWEADRYPFRHLRADGDQDCHFATPPVLLLEHAQKEINESRSQLSMHRRQSNPKYGMVNGTLAPAQKEKLRSGAMLQVIDNLPNELKPIPHAHIQPEIFQVTGMMVQDIQYIAALNEYETMAPPTKRMTQAEVQAVQQGGGARSAADRQAFELFCAGIAEDCLSWLQQYSVKTRRLPVFDKDQNVTAFRDYSKADIRGRYLVEVYVGSTSAPSLRDTTEGMMWLAQSIPGLVQAEMAARQIGVTLAPMFKQFFKALPFIRDVEALFQEMSAGAPLPMGGMPAPEEGELGGGPLPALPDGGMQGGDAQALPPELLAQLLGGQA